MARYAIDAPTLLRLLADGAGIDPAHQLVAPGLIRSHTLALLYAAVRRNELDERNALRRLEELAGLRLRLLNDRVSRRTAWTIAREQGWESTDDAEYLAVARLQADALVTIDPAMAARARGIVPLAPFGALHPPDRPRVGPG